jgi:hypothetical protein
MPTDDVVVISSSNNENPATSAQNRRITQPSAALKKAVASGKADRLRLCLLHLCSRVPGATEIANDLLLAPQTHAAADVSQRSRYANCIHCDEDFDVTKNNDEEYTYIQAFLKHIPDTFYWMM